MKKNRSTRSAFFNRRIFVGVFLIIASGVLALLAFGVHRDSQKLASFAAPKRGGAGAPDLLLDAGAIGAGEKGDVAPSPQPFLRQRQAAHRVPAADLPRRVRADDGESRPPARR